MSLEEEVRNLSLTGRMIVCLLAFEEFCKDHCLASPEIDEFIDYMWKWPLIEGPDQFDPWIKSSPTLIDFALGGELPESVRRKLVDSNIEEHRFRNVIEGLVEIIWSSFWGASEDSQSYESFQKSIKSMKIESLPPITPFKFSRFKDNGGWGEKPSLIDYEYWQKLRCSA
ncbi:hypothetical protein [Gynuella sunshinyii]|uniref:Uncharacterized protein n=1 Tax=Gynuella sunshinyii YC6258 TaxID=1445510 RepID=A0A0C5VDU0_9GAMM|nr:hypothetical protein [Gynuella sunshinyii]AJQ97490.1 hypothetical Protein YC6258_05460 [Gynuella sunshinyii YC6258]